MSPYYYDYGYGLSNVFAALFIVMAIVSVVALAMYIVCGIGLYKMARNTGLDNAWMAFVPLAQGYLLGMLAERSLYCYTGKRTPLAKINLFLPLGIVAVSIFSGIFTAIGAYFISVLASLAISVAGIAATVFTLYSYYYIYKDFAPDKEVLLLLLSIFIPLAMPIIFLIYMNTVPVSVAGRQYGPQPKYGQPYSGPGPQGGYPPSGGYQQGGYGPQQSGYGPQGGSQPPPQQPGYQPPQNGPQAPEL